VLLLEVMDKMPSAVRLLAIGGGAGALGFALIRRWRWTALALIPLAGAVAWARVAIYTDRHVGPAVWRESGWSYALAVVLSALSALVLPLLGLRASRSTEDRGAGAA
jgi:hypothetical protein